MGGGWKHWLWVAALAVVAAAVTVVLAMVMVMVVDTNLPSLYMQTQNKGQDLGCFHS